MAICTIFELLELNFLGLSDSDCHRLVKIARLWVRSFLLLFLLLFLDYTNVFTVYTATHSL